MRRTCKTWAYKETRFWDVLEDGVPVARLMMRVSPNGQCWPGGAMLLLKRERIDPAAACLFMARKSAKPTTTVLALMVLSNLMEPVTSGGSTDGFDTLYAPGDDEEEALEALAIETFNPIMSNPLFETRQ